MTHLNKVKFNKAKLESRHRRSYFQLVGSFNKLFSKWVLMPYQEIQALGFPHS